MITERNERRVILSLLAVLAVIAPICIGHNFVVSYSDQKVEFGAKLCAFVFGLTVLTHIRWAHLKLMPLVCTGFLIPLLWAAIDFPVTEFPLWFGIRMYSTKWEFFALVATGEMAIVYAIYQFLFNDEFRHGGPRWLSIASLLAAIACIGYAWKNMDSLHGHLSFVLAVAVLFAITDAITFLDATGKSQRAAWTFLIMLDVPMVISLGALWVFCVLRHPGGEQAIMIRDETRFETVEYFIAGAIAFQLLVSDVLFVVASFVGES